MDARLQAQFGHVGLGLLEHRRAAADEHQVQVGTLGHQRPHGVDEFAVPLGGAHHRHAADHDIVGRQAQLAAQGRVFDGRRQHDGRIHRGDMAGGYAAFDEVLAHVVADRGDAVRQPGIGPERADPVGQVAGTHDQRRARQPAGGRGDHGIAPAVRVQHVVAALAQQAAQAQHAAQVIARPVHFQRVHGEAGLGQAARQLGLRLADRLHVMAALAHGRHFLEDAPFLAAETGGGFGMHDTQWPHQ
ncbi:Uncharacterised protein [Bordetella pertussis]|nr:Uncharacterised protein [Bordetella pertussis]